MSEYLFLFRVSERVARSPDEMQKSMQKWVAWFRELNEEGVIKDPGNPLDTSGKVVRGHNKDVHDGPYAEAKDLVNGYVLIEAATIDHAVEASKGCQIFADGGSVEVRSIFKVLMHVDEHLFRREAGRIVSMLTRMFGVHNLALAENVVQDAFCRALSPSRICVR